MGAEKINTIKSCEENVKSFCFDWFNNCVMRLWYYLAYLTVWLLVKNKIRKYSIEFFFKLFNGFHLRWQWKASNSLTPTLHVENHVFSSTPRFEPPFIYAKNPAQAAVQFVFLSTHLMSLRFRMFKNKILIALLPAMATMTRTA